MIIDISGDLYNVPKSKVDEYLELIKKHKELNDMYTLIETIQKDKTLLEFQGYTLGEAQIKNEDSLALLDELDLMDVYEFIAKEKPSEDLIHWGELCKNYNDKIAEIGISFRDCLSYLYVDLIEEAFAFVEYNLSNDVIVELTEFIDSLDEYIVDYSNYPFIEDKYLDDGRQIVDTYSFDELRDKFFVDFDHGKILDTLYSAQESLVKWNNDLTEKMDYLRQLIDKKAELDSFLVVTGDFLTPTLLKKVEQKKKKLSRTINSLNSELDVINLKIERKTDVSEELLSLLDKNIELNRIALAFERSSNLNEYKEYLFSLSLMPKFLNWCEKNNYIQ